MSLRLSDHAASSLDTDHGPARAPGKAALTQRLVRTTPAPTAEPVQRALDPATAAIQRAQLAHDLAAACGFVGGPADSIDASAARVQRQVDVHTGLDDHAIASHAARGVSGGGGPLPHLDAIQRAFGPAHDVTGVRAHVGGAAAEASAAIGAHAYATGDDVAFASSPDLFLAAHEAAHVVQQRQGVSLKGAVGQAGDAYEQHADAVAAAVVRGDSAAELLGGGGGGGGGQVQRKTTSQWLPVQILASCTLDGSVYLTPEAKPPTASENKFMGTTNASLIIDDGYRGAIRIHLTGRAENYQTTNLTQLDLEVMWDVTYAADKMELSYRSAKGIDNDTWLGNVKLDVAPASPVAASKGKVGMVGMTVTPKLESYGRADVMIATIGSCQLPPLTYEVPLYGYGNPLKETAEVPPVVNNTTNITNITNVTAPPPAPTAPTIAAPGYAPHIVHFATGEHIPDDDEASALRRWADTTQAALTATERKWLDDGSWEVVVAASTSSEGSEGTNLKLAQDRYDYAAAIVEGNVGARPPLRELRVKAGPGAAARCATISIRLGPDAQAAQDRRDEAKADAARDRCPPGRPAPAL